MLDQPQSGYRNIAVSIQFNVYLHFVLRPVLFRSTKPFWTHGRCAWHWITCWGHRKGGVKPPALKDTEQWRQTRKEMISIQCGNCRGHESPDTRLNGTATQVKKSKPKPKSYCSWASQLIDDWNPLFFIFIGLIRMEASVTRIVVLSDILTGLILLSCPPSTPPVTLSKVGTVTYIKKWELVLAEATCLLQDNISSVELCSACLGAPPSWESSRSCQLSLVVKWRK